METNFELAKKNKQNYKRILDNLFYIDKFDTSLFVNINNFDFIDIYRLIDEKSFEKLYNNPRFKIPLAEANLKKLAKEVKKAQNIEELETLFTNHNHFLTEEDKKRLELDFENEIKKISDDFQEKFQKNNYKWKKYLARAKNINSERNIWPMQIGMLFVSVEIEKRKIFAPLFFKEVNIEISNSQAYLFSDGEIKINEKLVWVLEKAGFLFEIDIDVSNYSIRELEKTIKEVWPNYNIKTFKNNCRKINENEINTGIQFHEGMVLGIFNSFGSHQRKIMEKIIENDELDEILEVEFNKNKYRKRIHDIIFEKRFNFVKINKTNFSQDKATVSAMTQNTIIWGPPGTGKSQTISNIIANIIFFNKTGLVVSQKKAALDVLKSRMNKLSIFCLFILNDNSMNKSAFYEPIIKLIEILENFQKDANPEPLKVIYDDEKQYIDIFNKFHNLENYEQILDSYSYLKRNIENFSIKTIESIYKLSKNIHLQAENIPKNMKKLKFAILESQLNKKINPLKKLFIKFSPETENDAQIIFNDLANFKGDIYTITEKIENISLDSLKDINDFYEFVFKDQKVEVSDEDSIRNFVFYRLFKKIDNFDKEMKKLYFKFVIAARTKHRDPYKFVLEHEKIIKELFPIIISSVDTELSKWNKNEFDYVILDESSQIFIEKAFPILYLGKIKVLAGDDKQMQPTNWFSVRSDVEDIELGNIESILNYAVFKGVYSILLDKNYRSNSAALMTFSSKHFYESQLDVIDKFNANKIDPIEVFQVDGKWEDKSNKVEAEFAIEKLKENLNDYNKIILLTFNTPQRELIENLIFHNHTELEEAINSEKVLLKNIENIQGDEADLLIVSVTYDKTTSLYNTYVSRPGGKNALNVAISRARDKIIVIKSIKAEEIETWNVNDDILLFRNWLLFLELSNQEKTNYLTLENEAVKKKRKDIPVSEFALEIAKVLNNSDFFENYSLKTITNYSIGSKKIDLAIVDQFDNYLLGFLLDDYSNYSSYEEYILFKDKNNYLKTSGYQLMKIKKLNWLINKDLIIQEIKEKVNAKFN
ncbi:DEAD/DEAH box helicase [Mesomycoplasma lagogenitalium]|uniref:DEAD/DEAH box helicase n=1 Tax=Mesomycoplasma lagogenitalium TaxID=171286 RepID=A0ABY8LXU1_9BACT|nr:DEAD/DEAH box helicase [Mesomycoplasma lagogenitalium]WGI36957.1 DEAD/DEAH box helicase [Mesomycoplasma lagogenitalium]